MTIDNIAKLLHAALILVSVLYYAIPPKARLPSIRRPGAGSPE
jgi:hypothetical protein